MLSTNTILLIEDEVFISDLYKRILLQAGFNVLTALDGVDGVNLANQHKPDLILLDIMMPKMHGIDVLKNLKKSPQTAQIPVVLLTNLGNEHIIKDAFTLGAQGYFLKMKISPYDLIEKAKEYINDPRQVMDINHNRDLD